MNDFAKLYKKDNELIKPSQSFIEDLIKLTEAQQTHELEKSAKPKRRKLRLTFMTSAAAVLVLIGVAVTWNLLNVGTAGRLDNAHNSRGNAENGGAAQGVPFAAVVDNEAIAAENEYFDGADANCMDGDYPSNAFAGEDIQDNDIGGGLALEDSFEEFRGFEESEEANNETAFTDNAAALMNGAKQSMWSSETQSLLEQLQSVYELMHEVKQRYDEIAFNYQP